MGMTSVTIDSFVNEAEAETFVEWLVGQGEQDLGYWLEEASRDRDVRDNICFHPKEFTINATKE
jgi:hypothetical protein